LNRPPNKTNFLFYNWSQVLVVNNTIHLTLCFRSKPGTSDKSRGSSLLVSPKKGTSALDTQGHGVSIADDDAVMSHMDSFCTRIKQLIDVINTLSQYNKYVYK
jgi:hypothetical protein